MQGLFYFMVMIVTTLKGYYFMEVREIEKKIRGLEEDNRRFYAAEGGNKEKEGV